LTGNGALEDNGLAMKTFTAIVFVLVSAGLPSFLQGCAPPLETMDTEQIRQHSDEGFKEIQKEEDRHR